jgi:hypothetical protein
LVRIDIDNNLIVIAIVGNRSATLDGIKKPALIAPSVNTLLNENPNHFHFEIKKGS